MKNQYTNTYWNENGTHQDLYNLEMIQSNELMQAASRVYHDVFNNGISDQTLRIFNQLTKHEDYAKVNFSEEGKLVIHNLNKFEELLCEEPNFNNYDYDEDGESFDYEVDMSYWRDSWDKLQMTIQKNIDFYLDSIILFVAEAVKEIEAEMNQIIKDMQPKPISVTFNSKEEYLELMRNANENMARNNEAIVVYKPTNKAS